MNRARSAWLQAISGRQVSGRLACVGQASGATGGARPGCKQRLQSQVREDYGRIVYESDDPIGPLQRGY